MSLNNELQRVDEEIERTMRTIGETQVSDIERLALMVILHDLQEQRDDLLVLSTYLDP